MIKIIFKGTWRESCERTEDRLIYVYIKSRTKSVVKFVRITSTSLCRRNSISSRGCNWAEINRRKVDRFILNKNYINSLSYHDCSCVRVFGQSLLINIVTVQIYFIYFLQCIRYEWKYFLAWFYGILKIDLVKHAFSLKLFVFLWRIWIK